MVFVKQWMGEGPIGAKTEAFLQLCSFSTVGVGTYSFDDNDDNDEDVKPNSN